MTTLTPYEQDIVKELYRQAALKLMEMIGGADLLRFEFFQTFADSLDIFKTQVKT